MNSIIGWFVMGGSALVAAIALLATVWAAYRDNAKLIEHALHSVVGGLTHFLHWLHNVRKA